MKNKCKACSKPLSFINFLSDSLQKDIQKSAITLKFYVLYADWCTQICAICLLAFYFRAIKLPRQKIKQEKEKCFMKFHEQ